MEIQFWIIGQTAIDVIILIFLAAVLRRRSKRRSSLDDLDATAKDYDTLITEMKSISAELEKNLTEKKELTRSLLSNLDERLERAQDVSAQLRKIFLKYGNAISSAELQRLQSKLSVKAIQVLMQDGLPKEEIAKQLHIPVGELELVLKMQSANEKTDLSE